MAKNAGLGIGEILAAEPGLSKEVAKLLGESGEIKS